MKGIRRIILCSLLLVSCVPLQAVEHEDILTFHFGGIYLNDQYLSALTYQHYSYALNNRWEQYFRKDTTWSHQAHLQITGAKLNSPTRSNYMYVLGVQTGWGAQYHFSHLMCVPHFDLLLGPYLQFDLMAREHQSNVNKPYSMDCAADVCAYASLRYSFAAKKSSYRLQYQISTAVLGVMFAPEYGQSYYEITKGILTHNAQFSAWHNRFQLQHQLSLDIQLRRSAWEIGVRHEFLRYNANQLHFSREQVCLVIGTVFQYRTGIKPFR